MKKFIIAMIALTMVLCMLGCSSEQSAIEDRRAELLAKIDEMKAIPLDGYDDESVTAFKDALAQAEKECANKAATDKSLSDARRNLFNAKTGLKEPVHSHTVSEWVVDADATCSAEGSKHGTCSSCGEEVTSSIEKIPHTDGEWVVEKEFSITTTGTVVPGTRALKCAVCGSTIKTEDYSVDLTMGQKNALKKAASYLDYTAFSYSGLVDQLEYEKFSTDDAVFAADHCGADWNEQAALKAASYLDYTAFSRDGLIDQLEYEGFTRDQAVYGVDSVGL